MTTKSGLNKDMKLNGKLTVILQSEMILRGGFVVHYLYHSIYYDKILEVIGYALINQTLLALFNKWRVHQRSTD